MEILETAAAAAAQDVPAISVRDFYFGYKEDEPILKGVDLTVKQGSFTLFVGGTGKGKTTLLRHFKPEMAPKGFTQGSIEIFGKPVEEYNTYDSAVTIGYVQQSPENQIVCDTVWHELAFGMENAGIDPETMRRRVAEVSHFFGIEPWLDKKTDALSGGQKQLMTLASILALHPKLLLLDEPTSQLDPITSKNFLHALFRVNRELGITMMIITHEAEAVADYVTDFVELSDGKMIIRDIDAYRAELARRAQGVDFEAAAAPLVEGYAQKEDVVTLKDAFTRYSKTANFVLRGADLKVKQGTLHALVGGNGSGKSTLMNTVSGIMKHERGSVKNKLKDVQVLLPQNPRALFSADSVLEELKEWQEGCGYTDEEVLETAKRFRIDHVLDHHPYDLSGGQQQMVAFAKVILAKPKLLLLDEATKGLDNSYKYLIADELLRLKEEGVTVFMISHDLAFVARVMDVVSLLFDGGIACTQPTGEFFRENLFYRPTIDWFFVAWDRDWRDKSPEEQAAIHYANMAEQYLGSDQMRDSHPARQRRRLEQEG